MARQVPFKEHTLSTGITVKLYRVPPFLINEVRRSMPPPPPPLNEVDYGDGKKVFEPNPADPKYAEDLKRHADDVQTELNNLLIERGVEVEVDKEALTEVRDWMKKRGKALPDNESDKLAFLKYVCLGTPDDINSIINLILNSSQPTPEAIQEEVATFRGNLSG